jgi:hypothetical protein
LIKILLLNLTYSNFVLFFFSKEEQEEEVEKNTAKVLCLFAACEFYLHSLIPKNLRFLRTINKIKYIKKNN